MNTYDCKSKPTEQIVTLDTLAQKHTDVFNKLLIKQEWQKQYKIAFVSKKDVIPDVIFDLLTFRKNNQVLYDKLLVSIKLQLGQKAVVLNPNRVKRGTRNNEIYEFKSSAGLGYRLFFYFSNNSIIVCTNAWNKNNEVDTKSQDKEFDKANTLRIKISDNNTQKKK